jgi:hypothetical protein
MMGEANAVLSRALSLALDSMSKTRPAPLQTTLQFVANMDGATLPEDAVAMIVSHLDGAGPNDPMLNRLATSLHAWDNAVEPIWAPTTEQYSDERRHVMATLLGLNEIQASIVNRRIPTFSDVERAVVIAQTHSEWYTTRKGHITDFYWRDYRAHLPSTGSGWNGAALDKLSTSIDDVLRRLSDPELEDIYQVKGLVMGYVQSGKTSHFNGLIAKAVDAGYRLIIVLAGTLDILRRQTQRRIDKDVSAVNC